MSTIMPRRFSSPPTAAAVAGEERLVFTGIPGESKRQFAERLQECAKQCKKSKEREFDRRVLEHDIRWLAEAIGGKERQILSIAERAGVSPKTVRRHIRLAAKIIEYPLPKRRVPAGA